MDPKENASEPKPKTKTDKSRHVSSEEKTWRTYSKSLIVELKEKLAARRARTLGLLSEGGDLSAFCEVDTESDGLDDTSSQSHELRDHVLQDLLWENTAEAASLSETSSLSDVEFPQPHAEVDDSQHVEGKQDVSEMGKRRRCFTTTATECHSFSPPRADNATMTSAKFEFQDRRELVSVGTECVGFEDSIFESAAFKTDNDDSNIDDTLFHLTGSPNKHSNSEGPDCVDCHGSSVKEPDLIESPYNSALRYFFGTSNETSTLCTSLETTQLAASDRMLDSDKTECCMLGQCNQSPPLGHVPKVALQQHVNENRLAAKITQNEDSIASKDSHISGPSQKDSPLSHPAQATYDATQTAKTFLSIPFQKVGEGKVTKELIMSEEEKEVPIISKNPAKIACELDSTYQKSVSTCEGYTGSVNTLAPIQPIVVDDVFTKGSLGGGGDFMVPESKSESTKTCLYRDLIFKADQLLKSELSHAIYNCTVVEILRTIESDPEFHGAVDKNTILLLKTHLDRIPTFLFGDQNVSSNSHNDDAETKLTKKATRESDIATFQKNQHLQACLKKARLVGALQTNHTSAATKMGKVVTRQAYERAVREFEALVTRFVSPDAGKDHRNKPPTDTKFDKHPRVTSLPPPFCSQRGSISSKTFICNDKRKLESEKSTDESCPSMVVRSNTFILDSKASKSVGYAKTKYTSSGIGESVSDTLQTSQASWSLNESTKLSLAKETKQVSKQNPVKGKIFREAKYDTQADESDGDSVESHESGLCSNLKYTSSLLTQLLDYSSQEEDTLDGSEMCKQMLENDASQSIKFFNRAKPLKRNDTMCSLEKLDDEANCVNFRGAEKGVDICEATAPFGDSTDDTKLIDQTAVDDDPVVYVSDFETGSDSDSSVYKAENSRNVLSQTKISHELPSLASKELEHATDNIEKYGDTDALYTVQDNQVGVEDKANSIAVMASQELPEAKEDTRNTHSVSNIKDVDTKKGDIQCSSSEKSLPNSENVEKREVSGSHGNESISVRSHFSRQKSKQFLPRVDWSSSDDDSADDINNDMSPAEILRRRQIEQVDGQLEYLKEIAKRKRKTRSSLMHRMSKRGEAKNNTDNTSFSENDLSENRCPKSLCNQENIDFLSSSSLLSENCKQNKITESVHCNVVSELNTDLKGSETEAPSKGSSRGTSEGFDEQKVQCLNETSDLMPGSQENKPISLIQADKAWFDSQADRSGEATNHPASAQSVRELELSSIDENLEYDCEDCLDDITKSLVHGADRILSTAWITKNSQAEDQIEKEMTKDTCMSSYPSFPHYKDNVHLPPEPCVGTSSYFNNNIQLDFAGTELEVNSIPTDAGPATPNCVTEEMAFPCYLACKKYDSVFMEETTEAPSSRENDINNVLRNSTENNVILPECSFRNDRSCNLLAKNTCYEKIEDTVGNNTKTINNEFETTTVESAKLPLPSGQVISVSDVSHDSSPTFAHDGADKFYNLGEEGFNKTNVFNKANALAHSVGKDRHISTISCASYSRDREGTRDNTDCNSSTPGETSQANAIWRMIGNVYDFYEFLKKTHSDETGGRERYVYAVRNPGELSSHDIVQPSGKGSIRCEESLDTDANSIYIVKQANNTDDACVQNGGDDRLVSSQMDDDMNLRDKGRSNELNDQANQNQGPMFSTVQDEKMSDILKKVEALERLFCHANKHQSAAAVEKSGIRNSSEWQQSEKATVVESIQDCPLCFPHRAEVLVRHVRGACVDARATSCSPQDRAAARSETSRSDGSESRDEDHQHCQCHAATQTSEVCTQACQTDEGFLTSEENLSSSKDAFQRYVEEQFAAVQKLIEGISTETKDLNKADSLAASKVAELEQKLEVATDNIDKKTTEVQGSLADNLKDFEKTLFKSLEMSAKAMNDDALECVRVEMGDKLETMKTEIVDCIMKQNQQLAGDISNLKQAQELQHTKTGVDGTPIDKTPQAGDTNSSYQLPPRDAKGMDVETMKMRIMELTSQRDSEKVFHKITRQSLRALERDHDRLREEFLGARLRKNRRESESEPRRNFKNIISQQCSHCFNNNNNPQALPTERDSPEVGERDSLEVVGCLSSNLKIDPKVFEEEDKQIKRSLIGNDCDATHNSEPSESISLEQRGV